MGFKDSFREISYTLIRMRGSNTYITIWGTSNDPIITIEQY